jgi:ABC-2 type transport system permease protein
MTVIDTARAGDRRYYDSAQRAAPWLEELSGLMRYRFLIRQLVARSIKTRYKRSVLGVAWTMVSPLLTMLVLTLVFSQIFRFQAADYALHVLSGLVLWNFFAQSTVGAMNDLMWSGGLIGRIYLPKSSFAVAAVGTGLVNLGLALVPLGLIALALGQPLNPVWWAVPLVIALSAAFALGVGLLVSSLSVYFQDVAPTYEVLLTAWLYLTPVIYPVSLLPPGLAAWLKLNPMHAHVELFRDVVLRGVVPSAELVVMGLVSAVGALALGWWAFTRKARDYAYQV